MSWSWVEAVDFGNVPSWFAAGAAVVAVFIAGRSYSHTRAAYVDDVWQRKASQARLVWGERGRFCGKKRGAKGHPPPNQTLGVPISVGVTGDRDDDYEAGEIDGKPQSFLTVDATFFVVKVTNNSDEPIGNVHVSLTGPWRHGEAGSRRPEGAGPRWTAQSKPALFPVIKPKTTAECIVFVRADMTSIDGYAAKVSVRFTDSAGVRWNRTGTRKPEEFRLPEASTTSRPLLSRCRSFLRSLGR